MKENQSCASEKIVAAMESLLKKMPFEKITVGKLIEKANVSRTTFYRLFYDKFEVAEVLQKRFAEELVSKTFSFADYDANKNTVGLKEYYTLNLSVLKTLLYVRSTSGGLIEEYAKKVEERAKKQYPNLSPLTMELYAEILASRLKHSILSENFDSYPEKLLEALVETTFMLVQIPSGERIKSEVLFELQKLIENEKKVAKLAAKNKSI